MTDLLGQLADIGDEELDQLVKDAKKLRARNKLGLIPQEMKDSLRRKHDRYMGGQVSSFIIKPVLCFTAKVNAQRDYLDVDWNVKLVNDDDPRAKAFFDLFEFDSWLIDDTQGELPKLEPHLLTMFEQERAVRDSWEDDYHHVRSEFGVNAWDLVEEMKKSDSPPEEGSQ